MENRKHVFVVNPRAGQGMDIPALRVRLEKMGLPFEIYPTRCSGDATRFVKERAAAGDSVRFYACGGDGTLKEVVQGAAGLSHVSVAVHPVGSGNDFARVVGGREACLDLERLVSAEDRLLDAISVNDDICVNACHFGFDSVVASTMNKIRSKPIIGGRNAYPSGVVYGLLKGMRTRARIVADGEEICSEDFLLCSICNGGYVGGGYRCAPFSKQDDGLLELCLVKPVGRLTFLGLMNAYRAGEHLTDSRFQNIVVYRQCREVEIEAQPDFAVSLDGEIRTGDHFSVKVMPEALRFAIPEEKE
ncbi:MAG: hypothetical protein MJ075_04815 [Oscillospiraceae bacterium]|nr:hypothetical protein [Oscillospiraceae bacterium]